MEQQIGFTGASRVTVVVADEHTLPLVRHQRYRLFFEEAGSIMRGMDHERKQLFEEADSSGLTFVAFDGHELAASVRLNQVDEASAARHFPEFRLPELVPGFAGRTGVVGRLLSEPAHRGARVLAPLFGAVIAAVRQLNLRWLPIVAPAQLVSFYSSMGFKHLASGISDATFSDLEMLLFDMEDPAHAAGATLAGWVYKEAFGAHGEGRGERDGPR